MKNLFVFIFLVIVGVATAQPPTAVTVRRGEIFSFTGQNSTCAVGPCVCGATPSSGYRLQQYGFGDGGNTYWPTNDVQVGSNTVFSKTYSVSGTYTIQYRNRLRDVEWELPSTCTGYGGGSGFLGYNISVIVEDGLVFNALPATCTNGSPINLRSFTNKMGSSLTPTFRFSPSGVAIPGGILDPGTLTPGTYSIVASYNFYNGVEEFIRTIVINAAPTFGTVTFPTQVCADATDINLTTSFPASGGSISFSCVSGTCGGAMFYTSGPNTMLNLDWNGVNSSFSSTIRATITSPQGCVVTQDRVLQTGMAFTITPGANFTACNNGSVVALGGSNTAGGGSTVTWSGPGVTGTNFNPATAGAGTHVLTYSVNNNQGCLKTGTKTATVNAAPVLSVVNSTTTRCNNTTINLNTVYGPRDGGASITNVTWSSSNTTINSKINNTTKVLDLVGVAAGTYPLTYAFTNANGCTSTATLASAIVINPTPGLPTITPSPASPACGTTNFTLTGGGASGGEEYRWYNSSDVLQATGSNFATGALAPGGYTFKATRRNTTTGCESGFQTISLTVNNVSPVTAPAAGAVFNECTGSGTINLFTLTGAAPAGGTFSSSNGTISSRLSGTGNSILSVAGIGVGNYSVTYSITSGCTSSVTFNLNFSSGVAIPAVADAVNCATGLTRTLTVSNIDAAATYRWYEVSSGGSVIHTGTTYTTPPLNGTKTYYIEAQKGTCISPRDPATVTVVNIGTVDAGVNLGACTNAVSFNLNDGTNTPAGGTFSGPGVTGNMFNGSSLAVGQTYTITYTYSQSGCSGTDTRTVSLGLNASLTAAPSTTVDFGDRVEIIHNYSNAVETNWDFGDGWTLNQLNGVHYYYTEGPKTIKVYIKVNQSGLICDGNFTFNNFITVKPLDVITGADNPITAIKEVKAFPVPFSNSLKVKAEMEVGDVSVRLVDAQGKQIVQREVYLYAGDNEVLTYDEGEVLPQGIYILLIQQNKFVQPIKIIKR